MASRWPRKASAGTDASIEAGGSAATPCSSAASGGEGGSERETKGGSDSTVSGSREGRGPSPLVRDDPVINIVDSEEDSEDVSVEVFSHYQSSDDGPILVDTESESSDSRGFFQEEESGDQNAEEIGDSSKSASVAGNLGSRADPKSPVEKREGKKVEKTWGPCGNTEAFDSQDLRRISCIGRRTRSKVGIGQYQERVSYTKFFKDVYSEDEEDEKDGDEEDDEEKEQEDDVDQNGDDDTYQGIDNAEVEATETNIVHEGNDCDGLAISYKRRKLYILLPVNKENSGSEKAGSNNNIGISQRTRSWRAQFMQPDKKKMKLGTVSNPHDVDAEESCSASESPSDVEAKKEVGKKKVGGDKMDFDGREEPVFCWRKSCKKKPSLKSDDLCKVLLDTIQDQGKESPEGFVCTKQNDEDQPGDVELPLMFSFGEDDPKPVEKSDYEKMVDELWADFDFALGLDNIGSYNLNEHQTEDNNSPDVKDDPSTLCSKGNHEFILDMEIGIRCKCCHLVRLEIKHFLPSWGTHSRGGLYRKNFATEQSRSIMDDFSAAGKDNDDKEDIGSPNGTVWELVPQKISRSLYPHQREAFEFMWKNLAGGIQLEEVKSDTKCNVGGCVIAHAPGTGKTRLAIVFLQSYMKIFPDCRPIILAPRGMLDTWEGEFRKLEFDHPVHNLNASDSSKEADRVRQLAWKDLQSSIKWLRLLKLYTWVKVNGVLLISYSLFNQLTAENSKKDPEISKILLENPGLFVLDEGHTPRNEYSRIWQALEKVKSVRRIFLSGTPFQNNLREFYNTLRLVRPTFVHIISPKTAKLCRRRASRLGKITGSPQGDHRPSTAGISDANLFALEELKSMIMPFMHVYNGAILDKLPGLRDCFIDLKLFPYQKSILEKINCKGSSFEKDYKISMVSIHPSLLTKELTDMHFLKSLRLNPNVGVKTKFVVELIRLCQARNEKVLVFSHYVRALFLIKKQLIAIFNWSVGKEVLLIHGTISLKHRLPVIDAFNDSSSEARVLLASMKACGEGISLVGASRVVITEVAWNPSTEKQAISRAFRIGQEKLVYAYHLLTPESGESAKHGRQTEKEQMSKMVLSVDDARDNADNNSSLAEVERLSKLISEDEILKEMTGHDKLKDMFKKVYYPQWNE